MVVTVGLADGVPAGAGRASRLVAGARTQDEDGRERGGGAARRPPYRSGHASVPAARPVPPSRMPWGCGPPWAGMPPYADSYAWREPQTPAFEHDVRRPVSAERTTTVSDGHVVAHHGAGAVRPVDRGAEGRRLLVELLVQRVLVLQAAQQPPAGAGDLQRVDRQVLVLGHAHADRLEVLEERGAAQVAPARPDAALDAGLVARAELAELDAGAERRGRGPARGRGSRPGAGRRSRS